MLLSTPVMAQRAIMEGVPATKFTVKVDTTNGRVDIATISYTGGISNVGLFVASNTVIGSLTKKNAVVLYSTGSVTAGSFSGFGSGLTGVPVFFSSAVADGATQSASTVAVPTSNYTGSECTAALSLSNNNATMYMLLSGDTSSAYGHELTYTKNNSVFSSSAPTNSETQIPLTGSAIKLGTFSYFHFQFMTGSSSTGYPVLWTYAMTNGANQFEVGYGMGRFSNSITSMSVGVYGVSALLTGKVMCYFKSY